MSLRYWTQTEQHKQADKVAAALFDYQEFIRKLDPTDDDTWRKIYSMRCQLGRIEHQMQIQSGYKDGVFRRP